MPLGHQKPWIPCPLTTRINLFEKYYRFCVVSMPCLDQQYSYQNKQVDFFSQSQLLFAVLTLK